MHLEEKFKGCQAFKWKITMRYIVLLLSKYERLKIFDWEGMAQKTLALLPRIHINKILLYSLDNSP